MASWSAATRAAVAAVSLLMLCGLDPAVSAPVITDPDRCLDRNPKQKCCPQPSSKEIVNFEPESQPSPLRVRRPAHALAPEAARKYEKAVALMRALPQNHPWNFIQQSNVHCAYCSGGHLHLGLNITIDIHGSWHFFTWHRVYLYFYERILGKLINDTTFAIPFWNWDDPAGMSIPVIYRFNTSSLFNPTRYPSALNFTNLGGCEGDGTPGGSLDKQKQCNLRVMHRQFVAASNSTSIFFGGPLIVGSTNFPSAGPIEISPHNPVHITTGSDMSLISTAGLDPLFVAHHGNVDRLWAIWYGISGNTSEVFDDTDFLDASFLFWDENMQRVRIHVRDIIDTRKLGYVYEDVQLTWMDIETTVEDEMGILGARDFSQPDLVGDVKFPLLLSSAMKVNVTRTPEVSGWENLVVSEIELDGRDYVWFDVYVSRVGGGGRAQAVGCFIHMERRSDKKIPILTKMQLVIAEVIKQIGATDDDRIVVTLDPKVGGDKVTVGGVAII